MKTFSVFYRYNKCKEKMETLPAGFTDSKKFRKGGDFITSEEYFEYLMDTYGCLVYSICYKTCGNPFDAEDLTQEVYLSAYRHLEDFDGNYEKAWLCKIASRKCLDYLKHSSRRVLPTESIYFDETCDSHSSIEEDLIEQDTKRQLLTACNTLKPPYNTVAKLHFYDELTASEIADNLNINIKTIQTQIYRAKSMLKKQLQTETYILSERSAT